MPAPCDQRLPLTPGRRTNRYTRLAGISDVRNSRQIRLRLLALLARFMCGGPHPLPATWCKHPTVSRPVLVDYECAARKDGISSDVTEGICFPIGVRLLAAFFDRAKPLPRQGSIDNAAGFLKALTSGGCVADAHQTRKHPVATFGLSGCPGCFCSHRESAAASVRRAHSARRRGLGNSDPHTGASAAKPPPDA